MAFLLRHRPEVGELTLDDDGFVGIDLLCVSLSRLLKAEVSVLQIERLLAAAEVHRFEIVSARIRALRGVREPRRSNPVPDILYHATRASNLERFRNAKLVTLPGEQPVVMSADESQAWRVAHRQSTEPEVLFVDTTRARRHGVRFQRNGGLYTSGAIPAQDVLNLRPRFAEQWSAGGLPIVRGVDGTVRLALIRVNRRSGSTWEVAKGKLELGEPPEVAAVREVCEEMGIEVDMEVECYVGTVRYGFMAPGGLPRLKSVMLYLMRPATLIPEGAFHPSEREGIRDVAWFTPAEAANAVTHSSLQPLMVRVRDMLARSG